MDSDEDYKVGDVLLSYLGSSGYSRSQRWVTVTKVSEAGVISVKDEHDRTHLIRPSRYGRRYRNLDRPTARQVALRDWEVRRPALTVCHYTGAYYDNGLTSVRTPDMSLTDVEQAQTFAAEIAAVAAWLATKPVDPRSVTSDEDE